MKEIHIMSKNRLFTALVDDEDYPVISRHHWNVLFVSSKKNPYAFTRFYTDNDKKNGKTVLMHHMIMGNSSQHDHKDGNSINNQKENLRKATYQQNGWNKEKPKACRFGTAKSQYKGVSPYESKYFGKGWRAMIKLTAKGIKPAKYVWLGPFKTEVEAARAYNKEIVKHRGKWAWLNQIP